MKGVRILISLILAAVALLLVYRFCYLRYVCDREESLLQQSTSEAFARPDDASARVTARQNLEAATRCARLFPTVVNLQMIRAANLRILDRDAEAVSAYREALLYDRRPETFHELGLTQIDLHDDQAAMENLTTTAMLSRVLLDDVPQLYRQQVHRRIDPIYGVLNEHKAKPGLLRGLKDRVARPPA